jgi:RHS repeat-associated protein
VSSITDAAGQQVTLSYNSSGLVTGVTLPDPYNLTMSYGYTDGRLTSVATPGGSSGAWTYYTYNSAGALATVKDADGNTVVSNTYNSSGQVTSQTDGDGNVTAFSYTITSGGLSETDVTAPDGGITTYLYGGGMLQEEIGPVDDAATYYTYDIFGEPSRVTDPLGRAASYVYDASGDLTSETSDLGYTQSWTYDSSNNVLTYKNADGDTTTWTYNSLDEPLTETAPGGQEVKYTYNSDGSLASQTSARGYTTTYAYASDGMLASVTNPDGDETSYTYDSMGFPLTVTDALGHVTTYTYTSAEQVASVAAPGRGTMYYGYDLDGNLTSRQDPDGNTWTYTYNADGELTKATDPLGTSDTYGYDGDGDQASFTDGRGIVTTITYNLDDQPVKIAYSDGTPSVSYAYDADGEATSVTDGTGTRTLSYNGDGELTGEGGFGYGYDNAGNVLSRTYPDGTATSYGYNSDGQVASMTVGSAKTTYSYDSDGNLVSTAEPDGVAESRGYDNAGQLTSVKDATSSSTLDSYGLTLDADGEPTAVAVTQDGTADPTRYYGYDSSGRLTSECYSSSGSSACSAASAGTASGSAADATVPSGPVPSGETGKCLDDANDSSASGNTVQIWTCLADAAQTWTAADDGTVQVAGGCLAASGTATGSSVVLQPCTAHDAAEQWRSGPGWELVNPLSGLCLNDKGASTTNGTAVILYACSGSVNEQWRLPESTSGYVTDGVDAKCMDDANDSAAAGNEVQVWSCFGDAAQTWTVTGWTVTINSLCLEPSGAGTTQNTVLVIETCASGTAQDWAAGPDGWLWNVNAAMCASDPSASTANGTQLIIAGCASPLNTQQTWRVPRTLATDGALTSGVAGMCADNYTNTKAVVWTCNGTTPQDFVLAADGEIVTSSGLCLELSGGATAANTTVVLAACTDAADQRWAVGPGGAWIDAVATQGSQLCLTDPNASTTNGTQMTIYACDGTARRVWTLPATTEPAVVTGVKVTAAAGAATISWTPPVSGGGATITGYVVKSSGGQTADAGPDDTSATVTGLTAGTSYTFAVTAETALGSSVTAASTAIVPGNQTSYSYDAAGNLTGSQTNGVTTTNSYNAAEELTKSVTGSTTVSYGYDKDGNQTAAGSTTYTYNAAGELTGADTAVGNFTYSYNSGGDLAAISLDGTGLSGTLWDLNNPLPEAAEQTSSSGSVISDYNWNPDGTLNSQTEGGAAGTGTTYYAATDWEGSVTGLDNSSGTQVSSTAYSAYGTPSTSGTVLSTIGYIGSYTLTGSGLDNMRARDYSPATGEFVTVDPLLPATGLAYAYADDSPAFFTDPDGLCSWWTSTAASSSRILRQDRKRYLG